MPWFPFNTFTVVVPRRFPDIFASVWPPPPVIDTTPYTITFTSIGSLTVEYGSYERSSGHLDLMCSGDFGWLTFGAPPTWLRPFYGLDLGHSSYRGPFTTRSVPKVLFPLGPVISGEPITFHRDRGNAELVLVSAGRLVGGFADGVRVEFFLRGALTGDLPLGP